MLQQDIHAQKILILDFGSQYTQLIARRVREIGVFCEIRAFDASEADINEFNPKGIILAGGPESVTGENTPRAPECVFNLNIPVLGICYGMQTMAEQLGGKVSSSDEREFGYAEIELTGNNKFLTGLSDRNSNGNDFLDVWMSHGDKVTALPAGFEISASTPSCPIAAMANDEKQFYGVQFHPEVTHTLKGFELLDRFVRTICGCDAAEP